MSTPSAQESRCSNLGDTAVVLTNSASESSCGAATFFEKFQLLVGVPDAIEKIRQFIFETAIRGELSKQDPEEESGVALLRRIVVAKAQIEGDKRKRRRHNDAPVNSNPVPFNPPSGWAWTTLGSVQVFTNGFAFKSDDYQDDGVGIIRMGELGSNGEIDESGMKYVSREVAESLPETFRVNPGDLLMGMSGSIGKLAINRSKRVYLLNQRVGRLEPILIEKGYLYIFLKTVEQHYLQISSGMAIKNLSTKQINETPFPLPPLAEQKRIVAKVDELMGLCDRLEALEAERKERHASLSRAALARFTASPTPDNLQFLFHKSFDVEPNELRKTILQLAVQGKVVSQQASEGSIDIVLGEMRSTRDKMVSDKLIRKPKRLPPITSEELPFQLPTNWRWSRWGEVCDWITYGFTRPMSHVKQGPPIVTAKNVQDGYLDLESTHFADDAEFDALNPKDLPNAGDILITKDGSIGRAAIVDSSVPFCINQSVAVLWLRSCKLYRRYLLLVIRSPFTQEPVWAAAQGMAIKHLSITDFGKMLIPIPPLAEQKRIVAKVDELMALVDQLEQQLAHSRTLGQQLLKAIVAQLTSTQTASTNLD